MHDKARLLEARGAGPHMAMKAAGTLKDEVNRGQIGVKLVEVQVKALLDDLGRDEHATTRPGNLPKIPENGFFDLRAVTTAEARVE